jgi:hypothetical protein
MMNGIIMTTRRFYMSDFEIPPPLTRMGGWGGYSGHCYNYLYTYSLSTLAPLLGPRLRVLEQDVFEVLRSSNTRIQVCGR